MAKIEFGILFEYGNAVDDQTHITLIPSRLEACWQTSQCHADTALSYNHRVESVSNCVDLTINYTCRVGLHLHFHSRVISHLPSVRVHTALHRSHHLITMGALDGIFNKNSVMSMVANFSTAYNLKVHTPPSSRPCPLG